MATVQQIVTRALRRIGVVDALASPAAEDAAASLDALNEMLDTWIVRGIDTKFRQVFTSGFALTDTFWLFVPPADCDADTVLAMEYQGTWNASTNSPSLASSTGTQGYFYRVSTAGSTELDDIDSWLVDDALIYGRPNRGYMSDITSITTDTDLKWLKARSHRSLEGAVTSMLAVRLADEFGVSPTPLLMEAARQGNVQVAATYIIPGVPSYDRGIIYTTNRRLGWI